MPTFSFQCRTRSQISHGSRLSIVVPILLALVPLLVGCQKQKDVWINEVDAVQGVQTVTNSVPLMAHKDTFVKVAVQSNTVPLTVCDSTGAASTQAVGITAVQQRVQDQTKDICFRYSPTLALRLSASRLEARFAAHFRGALIPSPLGLQLFS